jgi:cell division protein ZapA (FtsZ GTPase activity inhibitor)
MQPGAPEKKSVRVTILNQSYTIVTAGDVRDTEELAAQIDDLMTKIAARAGHDSTRAAVLACFHYADRLRMLERELAGLKQRVDESTRRFSMLLDETVK